MRIALIGYGKMGKMIEEIALERKHEIVLRINIDNTEEFTRENTSRADVAIEFTGPDSAYDNVKKCLDFGVPVVSGSTGWNTHLEEMKQYCLQKKGSFLHTSNFSIGVNIFFEINKQLARLMASHPEYSVSMKEVHHTQKKDAPSGTALHFARIVQEIMGQTQLRHGREGLLGDQTDVLRTSRNMAYYPAHFVDRPDDVVCLVGQLHRYRIERR